MKHLKAFLFFFSLMFYLPACKKDGNLTTGPVVGKWNIVNISNPTLNYSGQPGDYYEFASDGTLQTKEGNSMGTFTYSMAADSTIIINLPANLNALSEWGRIKTLTTHTLKIDGLYPVGPGGAITTGSSISLSR